MFKNICLEMSLKPFRRVDSEYIDNVITLVFMQWRQLIKECEIISVMLWTGDGSEILEYSGDTEQVFEWGKYIGTANFTEKWAFEQDPDRVGLHTRNYEYMKNPPTMTYGILKSIVSSIKRIGKEMFADKEIRVGTTFDPGPEFAKSAFKFINHSEVCTGKLGSAKMVCADSVLNGDNRVYASFPNGIKDKTPIGTFLGRQSNCFLRDMNFDFLWLSNGFGFGTQPWGYKGSIFNGEEFKVEMLDAVKNKNLEFWRLFRAECTDYAVHTRGTNLTAAIDYASDGVPLKDIYDGGFNIVVPPNSPWAALDDDFGLEIAGYMSRMAELPGEDYMFRFYIHDPWWYNSPWIDMYESSAHDIYLPLSTARVNENGEIKMPSYLNFLTVDNSYGEMPDCVPDDVIPYIKSAVSRFPDKVSPVVWVYPFNEYQTDSSCEALQRMYSEDWFVIGAVNNGFPLNTVVSTGNFIKTVGTNMYDASVIFTPVPRADSEFEKVITNYIDNGGNVIFYGSIKYAGERILHMLELDIAEPIDGLFDITICGEMQSKQIKHDSLLSGGGLECVTNNDNIVFANASDNNKNIRTEAILKNSGKGKVAWVRASCSVYQNSECALLQPDDPCRLFISERLPLMLLAEFGTEIKFVKETEESKSPVILISRNNNGFVYSGYMRDTTVGVKLKTQYGAPLLIGCETIVKDGYSKYYFPRGWQHECRAFVTKNDGTVIKCAESTRENVNVQRNIKISGLKNADLLIFPEKGFENRTKILLNTRYPYISGDDVNVKVINTSDGICFKIENATGVLSVASVKE